MGSKKVTFDDIARHTGFSKTTISRFFNNPGSLTRKNQEIIRKALKELNYKENKVAQILATGETDFVGILVPNLMLHYYSEMLNQILLTYPEYGYKYIVFVGSEDPQVEQDYIQKLLSYQIAGLIVMSHSTPSAQLAALSIPIVSIEREDIHICSVNSDNYTGALLATELLQKNGCSEEEAYRIVSEEMWKFLNPAGMQKLAKVPFFLALMKRIVPAGFRKGSGYGWRYTWHRDDPKNMFRFECNACIYHQILGRRNLLKLGAMCCHADIINYGNLPYTDFIRTRTLCQGGDVCDFCFVRHETDAGNGWQRTKSI